jgi:uncharacterized protein (TIGR02145 family)
MKRAYFIAMVIACHVCFGYSQAVITLTFTATLNGDHHAMDSIVVSNLTRGVDTVLYGSDTVLVLEEFIGITPPGRHSAGRMVLGNPFPNPSSGASNMQLLLPYEDRITITLFDISGRVLASASHFLPAGEHHLTVSPGNERFILISVVSSFEKSLGKLVSTGVSHGAPRIEMGSSTQAFRKEELRGGPFIWVPGDTLRYTAFIEHPYSVVLTDTPSVPEDYVFELVLGQPCPGLGIVYDFSGNSYSTVQIGSQCWMVENLRTAHFSDGIPITIVTDNFQWTSTYTPARCWYNNDQGTYSANGALYNWYAVNTGRLCPIGWRVPTVADWDHLAQYLGGESVAGGHLKAVTGWNPPNTGASNSSGFTAVPGGMRDFMQGNFTHTGASGFYWTADEHSALYAWNRGMNHFSAEFTTNYNPKTYGFSVRCIIDPL